MHHRFAAILLFTLLAIIAGAAAPPLGVRFSTSPETVRVVLDLPGESTFTNTSTPRVVTLGVPVPLAEPLPDIAVTDPIVSKITVCPDAQGMATVCIPLAQARKIKVFTLPPAAGKPFRLVVDILKRYTLREQREIAPGINYHRYEQQTDTGYLATHTLDADLRNPRVRVGVVGADGERERVAAMVIRTGAVCGVNGGYFLDKTRPVGLLKSAGSIVSMPLWQRTAVAFGPRGQVAFDTPTGVWRVTLPDGTTRDLPDAVEASYLNPTPDAMVVNGAACLATPANPAGLTVRIRDGKVAERATGALALTRDDVAIRLKNGEVATLGAALAQEAAVTVTPVLTPPWTDYPHALGAGPRLLKDGKRVNTGVAERFKPDILSGRNARTGLGVTKQGHLILIVVEGPDPYGSGATLDELAAMLQARGAVDGMNLDGGGSSALALGAQTVNVPPATWMRPVADGLLLYRVPEKP